MRENRRERVAREVQKELSRLFQEQTRAMHGVLVSCTAARMNADLSLCTVQLSIFPQEKAEEILTNIRAASGQIRYEIGRRMGQQLRFIPDLRFFLDDSLAVAAHLDELLKQ